MSSYVTVSVDIRQENQADMNSGAKDMRKVWGQGICPEQPLSAVFPVNESTLVPSQPCRIGTCAVGMLFL